MCCVCVCLCSISIHLWVILLHNLSVLYSCDCAMLLSYLLPFRFSVSKSSLFVAHRVLLYIYIHLYLKWLFVLVLFPSKTKRKRCTLFRLLSIFMLDVNNLALEMLHLSHISDSMSIWYFGCYGMNSSEVNIIYLYERIWTLFLYCCFYFYFSDSYNAMKCAVYSFVRISLSPSSLYLFLCFLLSICNALN